MVVIESIWAVDFRQLRLTEPLKLERGLTIIRGHNEAGKSTLIEAILFGLYGDINLLTSFRKPIIRTGRVILNDIIAHGAKRALIEIIFRVRDKRYKVYRVIERRGTVASQVEARLIDLTTNKILATGVLPVAREVEKIIGVSWKEMLATNVVAQKDLERLVELSFRDREVIINLMMGLESFNRARDRATEEKRELNRQLEETKRELENRRELLRELLDLKRQYDQYLREKEEIEAKIPQKIMELRKIEDLTKYLKELYKYLETRRRLKDLRQRLREHIVSLEKEIRRELEESEKLKIDLAKYETEIKRLEKELDSKVIRLNAENQFLEKLEKILKNIEQVRDEHRVQQQLLIDRQQKLEELAKELRIDLSVPVKRWREEAERRIKIPRLSPRQFLFPFIAILVSISLYPLVNWLALILLVVGVIMGVRVYHRVQTERLRHATLLGRLRDAKRWKAEMEYYRKKIEQLDRVIEEALSTIPEEYRLRLGNSVNEIYMQLSAVVENKRQEVTEINRQVGELKNKSEVLKEKTSDIKKRLRDISIKIQERKENDEKMRKELEGIEKQLNSLQRPEPIMPIPELSIAEENPEAVERLTKKYEQLERGLRDEVVRLKERLERLEVFIRENEDKVKSIDKVKLSIEELEARVKNMEHKVSVLEIVINSLSEISRKLRESFAPAVEKYMGRIINVVTNGKYKAVKIDPSSYDIQVFDAQAGRFLPRNIYSGGANDQLLLAMRIAFTLALLRGAKGIYPRFLFLDEPLGSSDPERRRRILQLLNEELTRYFEQILLITHVETPEVPGATIVTMEEGRIQKIRKIPHAPEAEL